MDRRALLQGLLALPVASALDHRYAYGATAPKTRSVKLRVVLGGAFAIVLQPDRNWGVRVFTPTDRDNNHELQVLGNKVDCRFKQSEKQAQNFTLLSDGLRQGTKAPPAIDPALCDFNARTDEWCQKSYWVTVDLPAPSKIGFMGPMAPVVFADPKRDGCMPPNHVLEYDVVNPALLRMDWQEKYPLRPITCEQLVKRYATGCAELQKELSDRAEHGKGQAPSVCNPKENYESFCQHGDLTLFLGVGLPKGSDYSDHPKTFFNDRILESFPGLGKLKIDSIGRPGEPCKGGCNRSDDYDQASLRSMMPKGRLVEASSIVDCHVTGPIVTFHSFA